MLCSLFYNISKDITLQWFCLVVQLGMTKGIGLIFSSYPNREIIFPAKWSTHKYAFHLRMPPLIFHGWMLSVEENEEFLCATWIWLHPHTELLFGLCTYIEAGLRSIDFCEIESTQLGIKLARGFLVKNLRQIKERSPSKLKLDISFKPFFWNNSLLK